MRIARQLGDEWLHPVVVGTSLGKVTCHLRPPRSKSDAGSYIVDVFLDMCWDMVLLSRNVMTAGRMLKNIEFGEYEFLDFGNCGIELNPLRSMHMSERDFSANNASERVAELPTCLLVEWPMRSSSNPDVISQSLTASTVDWSGAKKSITSSGVICLPKLADSGAELDTTC